MGVGHAGPSINPRLAVEYLTLDEFVEASTPPSPRVRATRTASGSSTWICSSWTIVQFLTHRREMQAELLRLTDALQTANRQIVLTSDRPPAEIEALDERLIRRFAGGLIIDVAAPDYETRVAIPPAEGGGAPGGLPPKGVLEGRRRAQHRQRPRAARRAQPDDRSPGGG
jgi:hypothetical protein